MSYIDTFEHEVVGFFNGLPIYHPLETVIVDNSEFDPNDFSCTPNELVLGGGDGEHPALVVTHLDFLVIEYLNYALDMYNQHHGTVSEKTEMELSNLLLEKNAADLLTCYGWDMMTTANFVENAKSKLHATPFDDSFSYMEYWIRLSLGEFIHFSLPELNFRANEFAQLEDYGLFANLYWMKNITCPPPNYLFSKKQSINGKGMYKRGFFRWDYRLPE